MLQNVSSTGKVLNIMETGMNVTVGEYYRNPLDRRVKHRGNRSECYCRGRL